MKIVKYELIKIFRKKSIIIALLIFSAINIYKINDCFQRNGRVDNEFNRGYWKAYEKSSGIIDDSKINFVIEGYKKSKSVVDTGNFSTSPNQPGTYTGYIFGDMNMFKELYDSLDYCYNYERRLDDVISKAKSNIEFFEKRGNAFEVKNNQKIIELYGGRSIKEFYNTEGYKEFFKYNFSSLLIILILILGLASVFCGERETGMHVMLCSCKYGKMATVSAKIIASMIYTAAISIWFFVLDFVCFSSMFKLFGSNLPVYAMKDFQFTPLTMKIWQFVIFFDLIKLLGFFAIGAIIIFFSSVFAESLLSFILSAGIIVLYLSGNDFLSGDVKEIVSLINPVSLITNRELFMKYTVVNILGQPVFKFTTALSLIALFSALIIFAVVIINRKNVFLSRIKLISGLKIKSKEMLNV